MKRLSSDRLYGLLIAALAAALLLTAVIGVQYVYDGRTLAYDLAAGLVLAVHLLVLLWIWPRGSQSQLAHVRQIGLWTGLGLGLLWAAEISYNNVLAPPLPGRDIVDDVFWGLIALGLLILAAWMAYRHGWASGVWAGTWGGFGSGLLACLVAQGMVVFGMALITHDPLNVQEWTAIASSSGAPSMAAYFAFETLAGALLHLIVLGTLMGLLLGGVGGLVGGLLRLVLRKPEPNRR